MQLVRIVVLRDVAHILQQHKGRVRAAGRQLLEVLAEGTIRRGQAILLQKLRCLWCQCLAEVVKGQQAGVIVLM